MRLTTQLMVTIMLLVCTAASAQTGAMVVRPLTPAVAAQQREQQGPKGASSADRLLFWVGLTDVVGLTDAQLDLWKSRGVGGFIGIAQYLKGMGGTQDFTGNLKSDLSATHYALQRSIRNSRIVERAKAHGMKLYLGCYLVNYFNPATPLEPWFSDAEWSNVVLPRIRDFAAAAKLLGFDGIAFDQELYPQTGQARTATWHWNYPGNTHSEPEVREKVRQRGQQLMQAVLDGFPQVEIVVYHYQFPETWAEVIQKEVNKLEKSASGLVFIDFWDGLTSVEGYSAIRFLNADFYKTPHVGTWEAALQYETNSLYSLLSRRFSNWPYASSRVFESPFSWISSGNSAFEAARPPAYVAAQLAAFKKWGMGREFANYAHHGLKAFDYAPYVSAMQSASKPSVVDSIPPQLEVTSPRRGSLSAMTEVYETTEDALTLNGFAVDNLAIRVVRWKNDRGGSGTAKMTWRIKSGSYKVGWNWRMDWTIQRLPLQPGINAIVITAEDIKGLTVAQTLTVQRK